MSDRDGDVRAQVRTVLAELMATETGVSGLASEGS